MACHRWQSRNRKIQADLDRQESAREAAVQCHNFLKVVDTDALEL